jgi:hypothetical protein
MGTASSLIGYWAVQQPSMGLFGERAKEKTTAGPSTPFGAKSAPNFAQDDSLLCSDDSFGTNA